MATSELLSGDPSVIHISYTNKANLVSMLEAHNTSQLVVQIEDVVNMIADLRGVSRHSILQSALVAWFFHALHFPILETECHEQKGSEENPGGFLVFRVRLDANHEQEVASLPPGVAPAEGLSAKFREKLISALPGDLVARKSETSFDQLVKISWTKAGSIELAGIAAIGLVVLIVMAIGVGVQHWDPCLCGGLCPCLVRGGRAEGREYANALRDLRDRGAEFEVNPDGSACLRVPPTRSGKFRCLECTVS